MVKELVKEIYKISAAQQIEKRIYVQIIAKTSIVLRQVSISKSRIYPANY